MASQDIMGKIEGEALIPGEWRTSTWKPSRRRILVIRVIQATAVFICVSCALWFVQRLASLSSILEPSVNLTQSNDTATIARLQALSPTIEEMLRLSGTAGLIYGVLHEGQLLHTASYGYRDVKSKQRIDLDTIFPICSMSKALTSAAIALLVDDEATNWNTTIKSVLPSFHPRSGELEVNGTIEDFLSMRSGLENPEVWLQSQNHIMFERDEGIELVNELHILSGLRKKWHYNNWGYDLMAHVISAIASKPWNNVMQSRILDPLGLQRTSTSLSIMKQRNIAQAYMSLDDASPVHIDPVMTSETTLMGPPIGVRSCMKDLLKLYASFLEAYIHETSNNSTFTPNNPFRQVKTCMSPHTPMDEPDWTDPAYGLGWFVSQLPGRMGIASANRDWAGDTPYLGNESTTRQVITHYGSMPGALTSVNLFPDTNSAIIVLTNTLGLSDNADWVSQLLTETLFNFIDQNDYVAWTKRTVKGQLQWHDDLLKQLERERTPNTRPQPLYTYTGSYWNEFHTLLIEITLDSNNESLIMSFQNLEGERYLLEHYEHDVFTWLTSRNELASRGRYVGQFASFYKIQFLSGHASLDIVGLRWVHDDEVPQGEIFYRD